MPTKPSDLRVLADQLASEGGECKFRSAISRTYYSAYHLCLESLDLESKMKIENVQTSTHAALIAWFVSGSGSTTTEQARQSKSLGYALNQLRGLRRTADYFLQLPVRMSDVKQGFEYWDDITTSLKKAS